jgi:hypothetical protein
MMKRMGIRGLYRKRNAGNRHPVSPHLFRHLTITFPTTHVQQTLPAFRYNEGSTICLPR